MISLKLCFVAEGVVRDADTNSISAFNILEGIIPAGVPFFLQRLTFFTLWQREDRDPPQVNGQFRITIGEQVLHDAQVRMDFQNVLRTRMVLNMSGLVVPAPGVLRFEVNLVGGVRAEYMIDVQPPPVAVAVADQN